MARSEIGIIFPCSHTASQTPRSTAQSVLSSQMFVAFQSEGMMSARKP